MTTGEQTETSPFEGLPFPQIIKYRYLLRAIHACHSHLGLDAVGRTIQHCVKDDHPEKVYLIKAGQKMRAELGEQHG